MKTDRLYPRFAAQRLEEALADTPVVLIHGPRQSGKTTFARMTGERLGFAYFSFDDHVLADAAEADPIGFVDGLPERSILDEVQQVPGIFPALKMAVDRHRIPGRFLLTGSTNVLLVPRLSESLAGRMEILRLHPLSQCELAGSASRFLDILFAAAFKTWKAARLGNALAERVAAGGYPAAILRKEARRRATWYRDYVETLVQRDLRDLARIRSLDVMPRLLELAAAQTAQLTNMSELSSPFQLSTTTASTTSPSSSSPRAIARTPAATRAYISGLASWRTAITTSEGGRAAGSAASPVERADARFSAHAWQ